MVRKISNQWFDAFFQLIFAAESVLSTEPIVIEQVYNVPVETLWQAITVESQMKQWFFDAMVSFKPEVGFKSEFDVECEGVVYPHRWLVTDVIPSEMIAYDWYYEGFPGRSKVTWELGKAAEGSKLKLTHSGGESFPQDNPIFSRENGIEGWNYLLGQCLQTFFDLNSSDATRTS